LTPYILSSTLTVSHTSLVKTAKRVTITQFNPMQEEGLPDRDVGAGYFIQGRNTMSTQLETAKASPWVFTKTSGDRQGIVDTGEFFQVIDIMDVSLQKKCLLTIGYSMEIEIPSPAENSNLFKAVFILCTLDPTSANLLLGGVDCHPNGEPPLGPIRGVPFGNNFGLTTQRYHGVHSYTWVEKVKAGPHKIVMRAMFAISLLGPPSNPPPGTIMNPQILKRTLVVQAFPN
jgi:hypothetical protein